MKSKAAAPGVPLPGRRALGGLLLGAGACTLAAWAAPGLRLAEPSVRPASPRDQAQQAVMLGLARAGRTLLAVGERGLIVRSLDQGRSWQQASVPVSVSLTAVAFASPQVAWAVGHAGVVLRSTDGGARWQRVLDGRAVAALHQQQTQARLANAAADDTAARQALAQARQLVDDGPDKPWLGLHFESEHVGWLFGAYGLLLRTDDGGDTWQSWLHRVDNPRGLHLYALAVRGDTLVLAGEQGLLLKSTDAGQRFTALASPYRGSFFTADLSPTGELIATGLRGHAWRSRDGGTSFDKLATPGPVSFSGSTWLADGRLLLANQAGQVLFYSAEQSALLPLAMPPLAPLSALLQTEDRRLLLAGFAGAMTVDLPPVAKATS